MHVCRGQRVLQGLEINIKGSVNVRKPKSVGLLGIDDEWWNISDWNCWSSHEEKGKSFLHTSTGKVKFYTLHVVYGCIQMC